MTSSTLVRFGMLTWLRSEVPEAVRLALSSFFFHDVRHKHIPYDRMSCGIVLLLRSCCTGDSCAFVTPTCSICEAPGMDVAGDGRVLFARVCKMGRSVCLRRDTVSAPLSVHTLSPLRSFSISHVFASAKVHALFLSRCAELEHAPALQTVRLFSTCATSGPQRIVSVCAQVFACYICAISRRTTTSWELEWQSCAIACVFLG